MLCMIACVYMSRCSVFVGMGNEKGSPLMSDNYQMPQQPQYGDQYQQQAPAQPAYGQQVPPTQVNVTVESPVAQPVTYFVSDGDRNLRLVAFIFMLLSLIGTCWLIIPLAWMIPMTVISWRIYKGQKPNTTAFGVCTLIFASLVAGILLLISTKDR